MERAIFIVDIKTAHFQGFSKYCISTWDFWTKKNGVKLFVLEKPPKKTSHLAPHLQKYFAFDILEQHGITADQVAIVDADTMVRWDCPNFFEIPQENVCAVLDDELPKWNVRSLAVYQFLFPKIKVNWWEYFNSGFMIFRKEHASILSDFVTFFLSNEQEITRIHTLHKLKIGYDQTLFNYFVKQSGLPIHFLPKTFNFYHLLKKEVLENKEFIAMAYIWHFNGIKHSEREQHMATTWTTIAEHYN